MMISEITDFETLKDVLINTFQMTEPDWIIKKNPEHHSVGFGIFTNQILTVTVINFIEVQGYELRHIKPTESGGLHAFFVEAQI